MTVSHTELRLVLDDRSEAVLGGWYRSARPSLLATRSAPEARDLLSDIWREVVAFLMLTDGQPRNAEPIGASLVRLGIRPGELGQMEQVLLSHLSQDLPPDAERTLQTRLPRLVSGLTSGFIQADRQQLLEQQEEIRAAYGRSLRQAEDQLRILNAGIESSINAVGMMDMDGKMVYVNPAFLDMWGYESDLEVIGRHVSESGSGEVTSIGRSRFSRSRVGGLANWWRCAGMARPSTCRPR